MKIVAKNGFSAHAIPAGVGGNLHQFEIIVHRMALQV